MNDCKQNANNGIYIPILHDCHNSVNCNLKRHGYKTPLRIPVAVGQRF